MKSNQRKHLTTFTRVVILTAFYFVGGLLGKESSFMSGNVALVWPPAGIALAAILLFGYRFWPGVALGAVLFSCLNGVPLGFFTFGTAVIVPSAQGFADDALNELILAPAAAGKPLRYYAGGAWSRAGEIATREQWEQYVANAAARAANPVRTTLKATP